MPHLKGESLKIILIIILGWSCYAFADASIKDLAERYDVWQIMFIGSSFATLLLGGWVVKDYGWKGFYTPKFKWHILRGIAGSIIGISVVNAVTKIPLSDFYGITFTSPFLILILAYFLLKEPIGWHRWLSVIIGFAGVFILAGPQFSNFDVGYLFALSAMFFVSVSAIIIRKIGKGEPLPVYGFYPLFFVFIISSVIAIPDLKPIATPDTWKFAVQIFGITGGQIFVTYATAHANATASVAPFVYIQIIWGVVFGYTLFGDIPTTATITGLILIISAGLYMIYRERQLSKLTD